jgi:hypothetical protein
MACFADRLPVKAKSLMTDTTFRSKVDEAARAKQKQMQGTTWFQQKHGESKLNCVATSAWNSCW